MRLPLQVNWLAAQLDALPKAAIEFPLYSDSSFVDEAQAGPYSFLNTVPGRESPGRVQVPIVVRMFIYADLGRPAPFPKKTSTSAYHGGWVSEEVAALASLALGVRLRAGDISRRIDADDSAGRPTAQRREPPTLALNPAQLVLPDAVGNRNLRALESRLRSIPDLAPDDCVALVRAARMYQDALWVAESEPSLAWLMLVSALETAANRWKEGAGTPLENLTEIMPDLVQRLSMVGDESLMEFAAEALAKQVGAIKKFVGFVLAHEPPPPMERPEAAGYRIDWTSDGLSKLLKVVYRYRSDALHGGTPFPAPMCEPAQRFGSESASVEVGTTGLAQSALGGYWTKKDLPVGMHTFHYIVRTSLLAWWDSISKNR